MIEKIKRYVGAKLISENKEKGIALYQRKNGATYIERLGEKPQGVIVGDFVEVEGELTDEKLAEAKKAVLNKLFDEIRKVAEEYSEDFFIVKTKEKEEANPFGFKYPYDNTVGCKVLLPNIIIYEDIYDEEVNADDNDNI